MDYSWPKEPMQIRLLDDNKSGFIMRTEWAPQIIQPKNVIRTPVDFDAVSKPPRMTVRAREIIGTILPDIPYSPHRSKRVLKKLRQRLSRPLYGEPFTLTLPVKVADALKRIVKKKSKPTSDAEIFLKSFSFETDH